jgi:uroporphyrinogen-III decarboxylase
VDMMEYISTMLAEFLYKLQGEVHVPWTEKLFKVNKTSKKLDNTRQERFHSFVMKAMFLCKRARSDVQPAISFLASCIQDLIEGNWKKLIRVLVFLKTTKDDLLALEADDTQTLTWYVNAAFAVHADMQSHTDSYGQNNLSNTKDSK